MKKRWTAVLLALALALALLPAPALAAEDTAAAGSRLTGVDRRVYDVLREEIAKIADGSRTSTAVSIPDLAELSWSLEELGLTDSGQSDILKQLEEKFQQLVHMNQIYRCLSADLPFEMYWKSNRFSWGYNFVRRGDQASIQDLTIHLQVAEGYRGGSDVTVNAAKAAAATAAADNAKAIVAQYQSLPDYEKLRAYFQEICRLADYDMASAQGGGPYGDPWQLIYVFDGDPATNVVCEGYAKAFKYLCDLSDFDGDIRCRLVTGEADGGSHMWNLVQMEDGQNYLVDVTNCDDGIGSPDKLFLVGGTTRDDGQTCVVIKDQLHMVYTYKEEEWGLHTDGYLPLSAQDYVYNPGQPATQPPAGEPAASRFADVDPAEYYAGPVAWAVEAEVTTGTSETTFSPYQPCTHAEILTFLWRAAGEPVSYGDVPLILGSQEYYAGAVQWAAGRNMIGEDFDPDRPCDRLSAVVYIWQAFNSPTLGEGFAGRFADVSTAVMTPACETAVYWAVAEEVTTGTSDNAFSPFDGCSRGEIVTFLYRAYH